MKKIKTAVVGLGIFGEVHVETYHQYDKTDLAVVCDLDEKKAKKASEKYGCKYTLDSEEIAQNPEIEVVSIATPDFAHHDIALQMINAGKHVLIEKPLTTKVAEAEEIVKAAKAKDVKMMTDFQNRWNPPFIAAKNAIERGELGKPVMISAKLANTTKVPFEFLKWSGKSGPEWFLFPHIIDLVRWLVDQEPRKVFAVGRKEVLKSHGIDAYDAIQAEIIFDDCFGVFETSWILPPNMTNALEFKVDFLGTKGKFSAVPHYNGIEISGAGGSYQPFNLGWQETFGVKDGFFIEPIRHFVDAIYYDRKLITKPEDGVIVTKTIDAILRSLETGNVVDI